MNPENKEAVDPDDAFEKIGVLKEWIEAIKALGYKTVTSIRSVEKPGKLGNDLNGYKKKNKDTVSLNLFVGAFFVPGLSLFAGIGICFIHSYDSSMISYGLLQEDASY